MKSFGTPAALFVLMFVFCDSSFALKPECRRKIGNFSKSGTHSRDIAKLKEAALGAVPKYQTYFDSIRSDLKERDYLVELVELALLSKEHLLLMGPPGNAKSLLADTTLGNIKNASGKSSYYRIQMTPETTMSETHGPLDYKTLTETNRYERLYEEGMLKSRNVFIDEIFDARANAMRNVLGVLAERAHAQGPRVEPGSIETAIAATNKYIGEVYERAGNDDPKALFDRFALCAFVPGEFENTQSAVDLIVGSKKQKNQIPQLHFEELDKARALVGEVEIPDSVAKFLVLISNKVKADTEVLEASEGRKYREKLRNNEEAEQPYRATKFHSPRTLGKAGGILKAIVVRDWLLKGGKRELKANIEDIKQLEKFFTLNGPNTPFIYHLIGKASPKERAQLEAILQERQIFKKHFDESLQDMNSVIYQYALSDIQNELEGHPTTREKTKLVKKLVENLIEVESKLDKSGNLKNLTGEQLGLQYVHTYLKETLQQLSGMEKNEEVEKWIAEKRAELAKEHEKMLAEEKANKEAEAKKKIKTDSKKGIQTNIHIFEKLANDNAIIAAAEKKSFEYVALTKKGTLSMQSTPVTQLQWALVMKTNPSHFRDRMRQIQVNGMEVDPNRPVEKVSWNEVQEFIKKLNELDSNYRYRLPTEDEWENASRGGAKTESASQLNEHAWTSQNSGGETQPVAQKQPNQYGLHEMYGNVWEMTKDSAGTTHIGGVVTHSRRIRGGGFKQDENEVDSMRWNSCEPDDHKEDVGFRLVRTPK